MRWTLLLPLAAAMTLAAGKASTNARCGNAYNALPGGMTCKGTKWGNCCSEYGYCGKTKDYCGTACQSSFGTCNSVAPVQIPTTLSRSAASTRLASSAAPSSTTANVKVTTNARCGNLYGASPAGMTCSGEKYGDCCSEYSYCGSSSAYCGTGCQSGFGKCDAVVPSDSGVETSITASSSTFGSSSSSSASSSTSSTTTSTSLSSSLSSDSSTSSSISEISGASSDISITPASPTLTTSSSTASPSPTSNLQVISSSQFTTLDGCIASCRAESECGSFIVYANTCYLTRLPITSTNVVPTPGTGITYYNLDCGDSSATTAMPPTTPTSTSITSTSTVCVPPAPTVSCVSYPTCPQFTEDLSNSCPAHAAQCKDNYFVRCEDRPAAGSQALLSLGGIPNADVCRWRCDALDSCSAFSYKALTCTLWATINGFISDSGSTTFIRICPLATCSSAPVRRDEVRDSAILHGGKSVSIEKWNNGA